MKLCLFVLRVLIVLTLLSAVLVVSKAHAGDVVNGGFLGCVVLNRHEVRQAFPRMPRKARAIALCRLDFASPETDEGFDIVLFGIDGRGRVVCPLTMYYDGRPVAVTDPCGLIAQ